jgi:hypothetical protein
MDGALISCQPARRPDPNAGQTYSELEHITYIHYLHKVLRVYTTRATIWLAAQRHMLRQAPDASARPSRPLASSTAASDRAKATERSRPLGTSAWKNQEPGPRARRIPNDAACNVNLNKHFIKC